MPPIKKNQPLKPGEKVLFLVAGAFVVVAVIAFVIMQIVIARSDKPVFETKTHVNLSDEGKKGSYYFRVNGCTTCHRALRNGTNMGQTADLDGIGSRRSFEWIYGFLREPRKYYPASRLVDHDAGEHDAAYVAKLPDEKLHAIATFLSELKAEQGSAAAPIPPKGESPFIDSMVRTWAPKEWKEKYRDVRDDPEALKRANERAAKELQQP
ncbi:MAG: c-type cytochrome [Mariprofundaceae bacterium]